MTAVSRHTALPPSTPVHPALRRMATAGASSSSPHSGVDATAPPSPITDSPLPPAPVSAFIVDDEESDLHAHRRNQRQHHYSHASDEDSPGIGRRAAPAPTSSRLDDLAIPRVSYHQSSLQDSKPRQPGTRSSPLLPSEHHLHDMYAHERKSSPVLPSAARSTSNRYRTSSNANPISTRTGESSRVPSRVEQPISRSPPIASTRFAIDESDELPPAPIPSSLHDADPIRTVPRISDQANDLNLSRRRASGDERPSPRDAEEEHYRPASAERSPPPTLNSDVRQQDAHPAGYRTPAMGGRALRSSLAASSNGAARSAGRSLRKLTRPTQHHVPARRVQRYQDDEEDEDLDDAKGENGSEEKPNGVSGSPHADENHSPPVHPYGYDPEQARERAEIMDRASLVRSPSPPAHIYEDGAPQPHRSEHYPYAQRRLASGASAVSSLGAGSGHASRAAIDDILAAKVPQPAANAARRAQPLDEPHLAASRPVPAVSAAPPVPVPVPAAAAQRQTQEEEMDEEVYKQYSDCRPDLIWGEAARQREQPLTNHSSLMEFVKGPPKATAMQGLKYRKVRKAGRGGFSVVWVVRGPLYEPSANNPAELEEVPEERQAFFALKQVSLKEVESEQNRQELISEANTLRTLDSLPGSEKYLLRYFGHRVSSDKLKILLELGDGDFNGILATQAPLSTERIAHYWREMLEAVQFIHDANLVHTDLKPANFLVVKNRIKLIDFGIAQNIPKGTVHISRDAIIGTPNYMAPEAIKIAKAKGRRVYKAGKASDVWSLGCILYQMVYGRPPFDKLPADRKLEGIMDPNHRIAYPTYRDPRDPDSLDADPDMIDCLQSALRYSVEERATIPQLLAHPFLREPSVCISRQRLRDLVGRLRVLALQGELTEDNVEQRADLLFANLLKQQQQQQQQQP